MPNYSYIAKTGEGETQEGVINAQDKSQLAHILKGQGMLLINATLEEKKPFFSLKGFSPFGRVSSSQKILMVKNLGVMFSTGLPLVRSFEILSVQTKNKKLKSILAEVKGKISRGENLSDALAKHPEVFSELFCSMIKIGEESGTLDEVFQILSVQMVREHELKSKIINAMIYPSIIVLAMLVIGVVIITIVLPALNTFFVSLNVDVPIYTKIMLAAGNFILEQWYTVILGFLALIAGFIMLLRSKKGRETMDTVLLRMPIIAPIVKQTSSASFVRSLSSLSASGVSLVRSLEIIANTLRNHYFKDAAIDASKEIKKGEKLSAALRVHQAIFPFGVIEMMEVGEETGKTSAILKKLAEFYEQEAISAIEKLMIIIEPLLIVFLGIAVGIFAFSIIEPMYSSLQSIGV